MLWSSGLSTHYHLGVDVHTSHETEERQPCAFLLFSLFFFLSCFCFLFFAFFFFKSGSYFVALGSLDFTKYASKLTEICLPLPLLGLNEP